ncbi:unnamed protein product [Cuscuta campestris]|uniref:leucine--tRNA ligase n=1 Tax=Cuscuta campestris TaxID=132261 RepID=A0A484NL92_9ASTE|nr:unnamed protein product [Cuscuta campestris]
MSTTTTPEAATGKSFARRDRLLEIEAKVRTWWDQSNVFFAEPGETPPQPGNKFFGNFPFPYMNGFLHLGHAFSLSKLEFAAAYHRLIGANVLLPFAFHCTGMPIKASADKLAREIQEFGNPPVFPAQEEQVEDQPSAEQQSQPTEDAKFKGKKSKAAAKSGKKKYQWEIMKDFRLSDSEISKFQNPYEWLKFFPPVAMEDLKALGLGCDWRRSFITTDMNPYFDSFVKWQMRKLKAMGKIVKDVRYTIYSPRDGQPCADHDRATGEGVQPQEYTLIKMEVLRPFPPKFGPLEGKRVFLAAATLRPETMYGQTNAWVLPDGKYGAFEINETDVFIMTERAAINLAYQNFSRFPQKPTCLVQLNGCDLIGLPLKSPLSLNDTIYALPMLTILTDKGTGIVTSVPSDAPDDYMALHDLKSKPALREKYGVKDEWVLPFDIIPIIDIPELGDRAAEKVCFDLKIKSQNEKEKLVEAKKLTYLKGFTDGIMTVGEFAGRKVNEVKPLLKTKLIEEGLAIMYSEPEKKVVSRSDDECVVALTDQWYITYGEPEWKNLAEECLSGMSLYSDENRHGFEHTFGWLNQWACSRSFGLGTRIPWDEEFLVESLSDSTIYMAYYTISHILQKGDMYGSSRGQIEPAQLTDESLWERPNPEPLDVLHLQPHGHHAKETLASRFQAIEEFSADATRFSLADAGDGVDDANFVFDTANAAILRLTKEIAWMEEILAAKSSLRSGPTSSTFADQVFENEINIAVKTTEKNYKDYMFREALKTGFYDLQAARDAYRHSCGSGGMNLDLVLRFMDVQTRLIAPICPHYAEYVWRELLKNDGFVINSGWPAADAPDPTLQKANKYLQDSIVLLRKLLQKQISGGSKKKGAIPVNTLEDKQLKCLIYVNEQFDGWQAECLRILQSKFDINTNAFTPDVEILEALQKSSVGQSTNFKQTQKLCMPFLRFKKDEALKLGVHALDLKLPFGEIQILEENKELIRLQLGQMGVEEVEVLSSTDPDARSKAGSFASLLNQNPPTPGNPTAIFLSR